ncbi:dienelactone hydrolase family protein [Asticcacaulis sp. EMRT-3]|uniref:dienelactone hydrolase family protein n=1 Tax=Asticcacaulis sp. EMRT-3 TaxID=3040349 RepID=UPI0024AFF393|nr:dienelactone hydrolase family protein [Asticcacaulis sp. EMRT-3]MDI7775870.1 dienelactone hydrolase family protein [Asticcacaulis sp. EMRT-3]
MGQMITLKRPDGGSLDAWLSGDDKSRPGIIVIQEWWGLNDHIKSICERFAEAGYNALAPDLYHGRIAKDADEASHMMDGLDFPGAVHEDIASALAYLKTINEKVAVMGFCMGGALTIGAAARLSGFGAAVCFYGVPPRAFAAPEQIKVPFQGHFGAQDHWITPAVVAGLEAEMQAAGNVPEIWSYDADHAFFNTTRPEVYNPQAAELAWSRMMAFLKAKLN